MPGTSGIASLDPRTRDAAVLVCDISGSTALYRNLGDRAARHLIRHELARLSAALTDWGGVHVGERGDDLLGHFPDADGALGAVRQMIARSEGRVLSVHAGVHFGPVLFDDDNIYGDTVNVTARLGALANAGEACLSGALVARLAEAGRAAARPIGAVALKGIARPVDVFSLVGGDEGTLTQVPSGATPAAAEGGAAQPGELALVLTRERRAYRCREGQSLVIGRSTDSGLLLRAPWVSRLHAVVSVREGKALLQDRSAAGTHVATADGAAFVLRRETVALTGSGVISPAVEPARPEAMPVRFEVLSR